MLFPKRKIKNKRQKTVFKIAGVFAAVFCFIFIASAGEIFAAAGINKQINYQGRLGDSAGDIVADGNYDIVFKLYTVDTAGTEVWTGTHTAANGNAVAVSKGIFSVLLGSGNGNALNLDFSEDTYYLGVTVGADAEMVPRKRIASVPQAYNSNNLIGDGYIKLTGAPTGTAVDQGTVYVNPASATAGQTLLGLAVGGTQKFKIDEAGNLVAAGDLAVDGGDITSVGALTLTPLAGSNLNVSLATTGDFAVNTNQLYVDTSAGFVGIGTATPGASLDVVSGQLRGPDGSVIAGNGPGIAFTSYPDTGIAANGTNLGLWESGILALDLSSVTKEYRIPSDYKFAFSSATNNNSSSDTSFYRNSAGVMRTGGSFLVDGNVGIGTVSPGAKLDIGNWLTFESGTVTVAPDIHFDAQGLMASDSSMYVNFDGANGGVANFYLGKGALTSAATNLLTVLNNGNVGVGDATPAALFTVGDGDLFQVNSSGAIAAATGITSSGTITFSGLSTAGIVTNTAGGVLGTTAFLPVANGGTGTDTVFTEGSIIFAGADGIYSQNNPNFFWDDVNLRLGIGTVSPGASVDIFGTTNTLRLSYDGTNYGEISSNLNGQLVLQGSGTTEAAAIIGAGLAQDASVKFDGETQDFYAGLDTDSVFKIGSGMDVGTTPLLLIKPTGGVEIGVSSPSALNTRLYSYVSSTDVGSDTPYAGYFYNQANNLTQDGTVKYGVYIMSQGAFTGLTGAATTNYGLYINNTSGADVNYSAYFGNGNIGMGALDPDAKLTIAAVNATSNQLRLRSYRAELVATNVIGGIDFMSNDIDITAPGTVTASIQALASATHNALNLSTDLVFSTTNVLATGEAMRITKEGYIGVGSSSPASVLFISKDTANSSTSVADALVGGEHRIVLKNNDGTLNDKSAIVMEITEAGIGQARGGMVLTRSGDGAAHPTLSFVTDPSNGAPLERMTIDPNGFVGIGTTSPDNKLDIAQTSTTDSQLRLSNNRDALWNFGDVFGGVEFYSADTSTTPGVNAAIKAIHLRAGTDHTNADAGLAFYTTNGNNPANGIAARMVIENVNGNVGIGDTTPAALLTVGDGDLFQVNSSGAIAGAKLSLLTNSDSDSEMLRIEAKPVTDLGYSPQNQVVFYSPTITTSTYNAAKIYSTFDGNGYVYGRLTLASPTGEGTWTDVLSVKNGNVGIGDITPAALFTVGDGDLFQVSSTGAVTTSGGIVSLNTNSNFAVNVATGTSTGAVTIGGGSNTVAINSNDWDISTTGVMTGISGITNVGVITSTTGAVTLNNNSNYAINLATGTSTGTVNVGGTTGTQSINIGNGAGVKTVNLGSLNTTSVTTLLSGSGGLNLNVNNSQPTNIATGTSAGAISIGGGSNTVAIDSSSWDISTAGVLSGATGITSSGTITFSDLGTGTVTSTAGVLSVSSDERLKNIQGVFVRGITEIMAIDPILYKWNELSGLETESTYAGFSAQNIQAAIPEAVAVDPRGFLTLSDRPIIAALVNSVKEQQTMIAGNAVQLEDLDLKTIQGITTLSDLQSSVDAQLGLVGESLNEINGKMDDNQDILVGYGNRIESQEQLTAVLQAQVEKLQSLTQSEADLAYADLFSAILNVDEEGNVDIFGIKNFTVENIATGNLIATGDIIGNLIGNVDSEVVETDRIVVDAEKKDKPTIGTGVIPADADQVSIETGAVTDDSKIYITPIGTTDNQVVYVGNIEKEKGFEVKVDRIDKIEKKDINFNWWIVGSKKDNRGN